MARSQETYNKKEIQKKKEKKRKEKMERKLAKKEQEKSGSLDDMIAYVDENGNLSDTPPDPTKVVEIEAEEIVLGIPPKEEEEEQDPIRQGTVTFFNHDKGYGFIKDSGNQESIFVHINNALEELVENNKVTFEIEMGPKGPTAVKVAVVRD